MSTYADVHAPCVRKLLGPGAHSLTASLYVAVLCDVHASPPRLTLRVATRSYSWGVMRLTTSLSLAVSWAFA